MKEINHNLTKSIKYHKKIVLYITKKAEDKQLISPLSGLKTYLAGSSSYKDE